jgi:hypothetical protein
MADISSPSTPPLGGTAAVGGSGGGAAPMTRFMQALALSPRAFQLPYKRADWLIPFLVVLILTIGTAFILKDLFAEAQLDQAKQQIESNQRLSAEQRDEAIESLTTGATAGTMRWGAVVGAIFALPAGALIAALLLMLILNFGFGGQIRFAKLWFLIVISYVPKSIGAILFTILALSRSSVDISFGPAAFLPADAGPMKIFLKTFDLFEIWVFALQMIGVAVVTGLPARKARTGVIILWVIYLLFMLLTALLTGCMGGGAMGGRG